MNTLGAYCLILVMTLIIDLCARFALSRPKEDGETKPAGILSLLVLCFVQGPRRYVQRRKVIRQFYLSLLMVLFLASANFLLAVIGAPRNADVLGFALVVTPTFTLPFYHFLYGLIGLKPLYIKDLLDEFRVRGALAIILSANVIFIALEPLQHLMSLMIHFSLALLALIGTFYLAAQQRKRTSIYHAPFQNIEYGLEPMMLHYVAASLEVLYYVIMVVEIFLASAFETWLNRPMDDISFALVTFIILLIATLFIKIRSLFGSVISREFYEERALPLSFLIFGVASLVRYYF